MRDKRKIAEQCYSKRQTIMAERRRKTLERVRKCREKKKKKNVVDSIVDCINAYKSSCSLGKAVARAKRSLPTSSTHRKAVLCKLVGEYDRDEVKQIIFNDSLRNVKKNNNNSYKAEAIKSVTEFFLRDDITRVSPNVKDVMQCLNPLTKELESHPTRHLLLTIREAYAKYIEEMDSSVNYINADLSGSLHIYDLKMCVSSLSVCSVLFFFYVSHLLERQLLISNNKVFILVYFR